MKVKTNWKNLNRIYLRVFNDEFKNNLKHICSYCIQVERNTH